jgi:GTP cyclohydrolase IA
MATLPSRKRKSQPRSPKQKPTTGATTPVAPVLASGPVATDPSSMEEHLRALLTHIGEDPNREGLLETPARVLRAYEEHFAGYRDDASKHLAKTFGDVEGYDELVLVSDIEVFSHCEHHLVPFVGKAHVGYIPNGRVVGLSKIARVVDVFAKRLQVQEKLTTQIADAIQKYLAPQGVAVVMQCQHFCMCYRGVRKPGAWTTTSKLHGCFLTDPAARMELLTLIGMRRDICN